MHAEGVDRKRLYLLGAAALGAVVVAAILIIVGTGGGSSATTTSAAAAPTTTATPTASLAGIPQTGVTLGRAAAPVTVQVFEDPQCPYCKQWNVDTLPSVVASYVRTGKIKLVYRGINIVGPNSEYGLRAIYAAGQQGRLWQMVDELYARQGAENSGWITDSVIQSAVKSAGGNPASLMGAFSTAPVTAMWRDAEDAATANAVRGTPTFVVQRAPALPTQLQLTGLDPASFAAALDPLLQ
jgi:protein-disulfide isomerase